MSFTPLGATSGANSKNASGKKPEVNVVIELTELVFAELFGTERAHLAKPLFLKNRTLTVTCHNAEIAQEIRTRQQEIVDKVNEKLGKNEVDRIRYLT